MPNDALNITAPNITVDIVIEDEGWPQEAEALAERAALAALAATLAEARPDIQDGELSVVLANDQLVRGLNAGYRDQDKPTNVLSFALTEVADAAAPGAPVMLGDVILARETIVAEAIQQNKPLLDHMTHLVAHGVLHLLGYDHQVDEDASTMEGLEVRILATLGVGDPYADPPASDAPSSSAS